MLNPVKLLTYFISNSWMAMSNTNGWDTSKVIKILLTILIIQVLHLSFNNHNRVSVEKECRWTHVFLSLCLHFFKGRSCVFWWNITTCWDLWLSHSWSKLTNLLFKESECSVSEWLDHTLFINYKIWYVFGL